MHQVLKAFPCSFDGIKSEPLLPGDERDFGSMADGLKKAGLIGDIPPANPGLRDDGPTIAEYVAAGYPASKYPPEGYASRSTPEEIEEAVAAENAAKALEAMTAELAKLTITQLREIGAGESIEFGEGDKKADLVDKIIAARTAAE